MLGNSLIPHSKRRSLSWLFQPQIKPLPHADGTNPQERLNDYDFYLRVVRELNLATKIVKMPHSFKETMDPGETEAFLASAGRVRPNGSDVTFQKVTEEELRAFYNPRQALNGIIIIP